MQFLRRNQQWFFRVWFALIVGTLFITRFIGNAFDHLRHLHPDERWLVMVVGKLHFFDNLDPDFFAYGSFPLYILKILAQTSDALFGTLFDNYDGLLVLGRYLSSTLDIATAMVVFLLAKKITRNLSAALLSCTAYALMFFPIQNSNFFIVDNFVNLFFSVSLLLLLVYLEKPKLKTAAGLGLVFGFLLASKITPIFLGPLFFLLILGAPLIHRRTHHSLFDTIRNRIHTIFRLQVPAINRRRLQYRFWLTPVLKGFVAGIAFSITTITAVFIGMPYTILHYPQFIKEISAQIQMNTDPYIFPYTLQYVATTPYWYYLKQIVLWGMGPILATTALVGCLWLVRLFAKKLFRRRWIALLTNPLLVYFLINLIYFGVLGRSAVKFMRYMLPLYPALAILVGIGLSGLLTFKKLPKAISTALTISIVLAAGLWITSFVSIYTRPHSREAASAWMLKHIPAGSKLAEEHWDDRLPLYGGELFQYIDLPLYELPDDQKKWNLVNSRLGEADYIVLTSNRLYGSLPKLADCTKYKKCYPQTARYYQDLFAGRLGFAKVAEFTSRPSLFEIEILDDNADESFTVYDHPRVLIFKKQY